MATNDGGPAYPAPNYVVPADLAEQHVARLGTTRGMSLRDYFAAAVVTGGLPMELVDQLVTPPTEPDSHETWRATPTGACEYVVPASEVARRIATAAYLIADAMLAERERSR
jgi:hypothetical protein